MPDEAENEIVVERRGPAGLLTLNRPGSLNALSLNMIRSVSKILRRWADDQEVRAVILTGAGARAFCAGGDIKAVFRAGMASPGDPALPERYFADEYRLNIMMHRYKKPLVALMNGIVMGGGYGLAGQCRFRVGCEKTRFAMPETGIGFFPDVGSAWHLARMPDNMGRMLGLAGITVGAADAKIIGVSTHHTESGHMAQLPGVIQAALEAAPDADAAVVIGAVLQQAAADAPGQGVLNGSRTMIRDVFGAADIDAILAGLRRDGSAFALDLAATIESRSPTSLKVTALHLDNALKDKSFEAVIERDYTLVRHFLRGRDFYEGIRAAVIDRDRAPRWNPAALAEVGDADIAAYFAPEGAFLAESRADL